jgi:predicted metal-binding protein
MGTQTHFSNTQFHNGKFQSDQRIILCTECPHRGGYCAPGYAILARLQMAVAAAGDTLEENFLIEGTTRLQSCAPPCSRPCTLAWRASRSQTWLFGDVPAETEIETLVRDARAPATPAATIITAHSPIAPA